MIGIVIISAEIHDYFAYYDDISPRHHSQRSVFPQGKKEKENFTTGVPRATIFPN